MMMSDSRKKSIRDRLAHSGLAAQAGFLGGIVGIVALVLAPLAFAISGAPGVVAVVAAGGACLVGGELALLMGALLARRVGTLQSVLAGMVARLTLPLFLGLAIHVAAPALTSAGLFFYFLVFYPVVLAAETLLAVAHLPHDTTTRSHL